MHAGDGRLLSEVPVHEVAHDEEHDEEDAEDDGDDDSKVRSLCLTEFPQGSTEREVQWLEVTGGILTTLHPCYGVSDK